MLVGRSIRGSRELKIVQIERSEAPGCSPSFTLNLDGNLGVQARRVGSRLALRRRGFELDLEPIHGRRGNLVVARAEVLLRHLPGVTP